MNPDGILLDVSISTARTTGYDPSSLIGKSFVPLVHPDDVGTCWECLKKVLAMKTALRSEKYRFRQADNTWHWHVATCTPVLGLEGEVISIVGVSQDISDNKQNEEKLKESEEEFRAIFNTASIGVNQADPQTGSYLRVNRKMCEITGYSTDEMLGMSIRDITHPEDREQDWDLYQRLSRGETAEYSQEKRYIRKDGKVIWVNVNATAVRDAGGKPLRTVATIEDISGRKEAERTLRESEEKFRKIFQTYQDSISATRISDGTYSLINEGFTKETGYTEADVIGKTSFEIGVWENPEDRRRVMEGIGKDGMVKNYETKFRRKDGGINYGIMSASIVDLNGIPHLLSVTRDLTGHRLAERKQRESEKKFSKIFRNSPSCIAFTQYDDAGLVDVNEMWVQTYGITREDVMGKTASELGLWASPEDRESCIARLREEGRFNNFETVFNTHRGPRTFIVGAEVIELMDKKFILWVSHDINDRKKAEEELDRAVQLLNAVREAQSLYITRDDPQPVFDTMLQKLVRITDSEFGFLDEVLHDPDGTPYKLSLSQSNIAWDSASRDLNEQLRSRNLEFRDLNNLAGLAVLLNKPVISNDVPNDKRSKGLPPGHPPINSFMGLPVLAGGEMVGLIGVANRRGGYDEKMLRFLEPYTNACGGLIQAFRLRSKERETLSLLEKSEAKFRAMAENILDGILFLDEKGNVIYRSPSYQLIDGYTFEERLGRGAFDVIHPEDLGACQQKWAEGLSHAGAIGRAQYRIRHKNGHWVWIDVFGQNMLDNPALQAVFLTVRDVSQRKQAEEELERARDFIENVEDSCFEIDFQGNITFCNAASLRLLGYTHDEMLHLSLQDRHPSRKKRRESMNSIMPSTKRVLPPEVLNINFCGKTAPLQL